MAQPTSDGLQPTSDGLQLNSDGLQRRNPFLVPHGVQVVFPPLHGGHERDWSQRGLQPSETP